MSQKYFKNISNRTSPSNFHVTNGIQQFTKLIVKKNPTQSSLKLLHKKSTKELLPKYLLHINSEVEKERLLYEIEQQNLKLKQQFTMKKTLEQKLIQKNNPDEQKLQLKTTKPVFQRKNSSLSKVLTSSSSQMQLLAQRSVQNEIKSIKGQIDALLRQKEKNQRKINDIKLSRKYTRFVENNEQKNTFLTQLKQLQNNLKGLKEQIRNIKRSHLSKKRLRIQQLLMQGEIENKIEWQNIELYNRIEQIKEVFRQVSSKKARMVIQKRKLVDEIEKMKETYDIPVEIMERFYQTIQASRRCAGYSSLGSSKISFKKWQQQSNDIPNLIEQGVQEEEDSSDRYDCNKKRQNYSQHNQQKHSDISERAQGKRIQQEKKTIEQLEKKYFYSSSSKKSIRNNQKQSDQYEDEYQEYDDIQDDRDIKQQQEDFNDDDDVEEDDDDDENYGNQQYEDEQMNGNEETQQQDFDQEYEMIDNIGSQMDPKGHFGTAKHNHETKNQPQINTYMNKFKRGVSF